MKTVSPSRVAAKARDSRVPSSPARPPAARIANTGMLIREFGMPRAEDCQCENTLLQERTALISQIASALPPECRSSECRQTCQAMSSLLSYPTNTFVRIEIPESLPRSVT